MDVPSLMRQAAHFYADRTAIITREKKVTFAAAWERGVRMANALISYGIAPGDRVAMVEDNTLPAVDLILGAAIAGAVRVPLYARNSRSAHRAMIESTESRIVFADPAYADSVTGLTEVIATLDRIIVRDETYESWLLQFSNEDPLVSVRPDDWYIIRHSSGTSGRPKGVGYRQHSWVANCRNWVIRLPNLKADSVFGHAAPISHASGYLFLPTWLEGGANLLFGAFDPAVVIEMCARHGVTHTFLAPTMVGSLCATAGAVERDWSALRCIVTGGSPIADATITAARRTFGDVLYQVFGQTEATPLTMMTPEEWFAEVPGSNPMRSAGRVLPYAEIGIFDEDDRPCKIGDVGEICARIEAQMEGYWRDEQLSATRIRDGWVRTGDIGRLDQHGYLYVLDRVDDMIVSGGLNIWPSELETVIADHPDVREVAVFGVPHAEWGETPMAVCYVSEDARVEESDIINLVAERMGSYLKPTAVEFVQDPLPKSVVGKILRRRLREPHWKDRESRVGGA